MPASNAGTKSSSWMRSKGGIWKGSGLGSKKGFFAMSGVPVAAGAWAAAAAVGAAGVFGAALVDAPLPSTEAQAASTSEDAMTKRREVTDAP